MAKKTKKELLKENLLKANKYHNEFTSSCRAATKACLTAIEYARLCGEALIKCKKLKPHGTWKDWLAENFTCKSYESAVNYMRIAEEWDSDYLQSGIESGVIRLSQNSILQAVRQKRKEKEEEARIEKWPKGYTRIQWEKVCRQNAFKSHLRKQITHNLNIKIKQLEGGFEQKNIEMEGLFLLSNIFNRIVSHSVWEIFEEKFEEELEKQIESKEFCSQIEDEIAEWKKWYDIEEARKICPESIIQTSDGIYVDKKILNAAKKAIEERRKALKNEVVSEIHAA